MLILLNNNNSLEKLMTDEEVKNIIIEVSKLRTESSFSQVMAVLSKMADSNPEDLNNFLTFNFSIGQYITLGLAQIAALNSVDAPEC